MKKANRIIKKIFSILLPGLVLMAQAAYAGDSIIPPEMREIAVQQGQNARKAGLEADLGPFMNAPLMQRTIEINASQFGLKGSIRAVVGGRNFSAADVDFAMIPFSTSNGYGLSNLYHDGGDRKSVV